jgi:3-isopropylmalate dehydrogenase
VSTARIVLLPGDGIGPEVTAAARQVLASIAAQGGHDFEFQEALIGGAATDSTGNSLPTATLDLCRDCDAMFLGAVGGPSWANLEGLQSPEQGLLRLRRELGLFANLRPIPVFPALIPASPLKPELLEGVDLLFVRELTGGIYFGPRQEVDSRGQASDTMVYSVREVERVAHVAFQAAKRRRQHVTSVDKANVLASSRLWRHTVNEVSSLYPDVELQHLYVDACAMQLLRSPRDFDVVLTGNLFGDILSDEASMLAGSLGVLPSASLSADSRGLYEPVHGSAPDLAAQGIANPLGSILSAAMLLRYSLGLPDEALAIESAVASTLEAGLLTFDLAGPNDQVVSTQQMADAIVAALH